MGDLDREAANSYEYGCRGRILGIEEVHRQLLAGARLLLCVRCRLLDRHLSRLSIDVLGADDENSSMPMKRLGKHTLRCFFSGRGRTPALPAFAPATIGVAFPFPLALCPLAPYVMPIGTAVPFTPCTASLECSRSRLTPRFGAAGSMIACEGVGVLRPGVNATVAAGVGILTLALGVGIDCGVPIPTGVRPRG